MRRVRATSVGLGSLRAVLPSVVIVLVVLLLLATTPTTVVLGFSVVDPPPRMTTSAGTTHERSFSSFFSPELRRLSRDEFLAALVATSTSFAFVPTAAQAFEGGVGGLGKTKPETGVEFLEGSIPWQGNGASGGPVGAEILVQGRPIRVAFDAPWPLLTGSRGLETRDLQTSDSAFVQVVVDHATLPTTAQSMQDLLLRSIFAPQGKFSAYGSPYDVVVRSLPSNNPAGSESSALPPPLLYSVSFTTLTPGLRESARKAVVSCRAVRTGSTTAALILLVAGSTAARYKSNPETFAKVAQSLVAYEAPPVARRLQQQQPPSPEGE